MADDLGMESVGWNAWLELLSADDRRLRGMGSE